MTIDVAGLLDNKIIIGSKKYRTSSYGKVHSDPQIAEDGLASKTPDKL